MSFSKSLVTIVYKRLLSLSLVKFIIGDLNAKVGRIVTPNTDCGKFGLGKQNERGERLIEFCSTNNTLITNTMFQHHPQHLYTWTSPDRKPGTRLISSS